MIEKKGDLWWPRFDYHCRSAAMAEKNDIPPIITYCSQKRIAVQAGGNVGVFPLELIKYFDEVYTFEPDPENFKCLKLNCQKENKIYINNKGLGDKSDNVGLHKEFDNCGAHYIEGKGDIEIVTLDSFNLSGCDLLWLDIEGYEYKALLGAIETIKRYKPIIVCEEKGLGRFHSIDPQSISLLLSELEYKIRDKIGNDVVYMI